jgi:hypothetical protein
MARGQLAEIHFDSGRADPAMAELDAIKDSRVRDPTRTRWPPSCSKSVVMSRARFS